MEYKQIMIVRQDLKMGKGKLAVQVAHAAVSSAEKTRQLCSEWFRGWLDNNQAKICVKVQSEHDLLDLKEAADRENLPNVLIQDAGLTQLDPGTTTCLGVGPMPVDLADRYFGHLKLL